MNSLRPLSESKTKYDLSTFLVNFNLFVIPPKEISSDVKCDMFSFLSISKLNCNLTLMLQWWPGGHLWSSCSAVTAGVTMRWEHAISVIHDHFKFLALCWWVCSLSDTKKKFSLFLSQIIECDSIKVTDCKTLKRQLTESGLFSSVHV